MNDIIVIGAGGLGRETKQLIDEINEYREQWNFLGYVTDVPNPVIPENDPVLGEISSIYHMEKKPYTIIAISDIAARVRIAADCKREGVPFATLVHPTVKPKGNLCTIGEGSIIFDDARLAINTHVGSHCLIGMKASLGHDTKIGNYVNLLSRAGVAGYSRIGDRCSLGMRSSVIDHISVEDDCVIGAGAVVVRDICAPGVYFGVPARKKREKN